MTPRERMAVAMRHGVPDRVPVMCQLALGHYFLNAGLDPVDVERRITPRTAAMTQPRGGRTAMT